MAKLVEIPYQFTWECVFPVSQSTRLHKRSLTSNASLMEIIPNVLPSRPFGAITNVVLGRVLVRDIVVHIFA